MTEPVPMSLGEPADEAAWRGLIEKALKGAPFERLISRTADGVPLKPLYRETDFPAADDPSGLPGAAPFIRGAETTRDPKQPWAIRQRFDHPDPSHANADILADLAGGVSALELAIDPEGANGIAVRDGADLDLLLANVIPEAAPIGLDAGAHGLWAADLLAAKLKGVAAAGAAFNVDPLGALMKGGAIGAGDLKAAAEFARKARHDFPRATALRVDARPVHEAGGSEAAEIAAALSAGVAYVRAIAEAGLGVEEAGKALLFTLAVGPDTLVEASKLRALRLTWARVMEAAGAAPEARAARIHAITSRRMMARHDAWTNILRATTASFAAAVGGAQAITVLPLTDALGLATPFSRRIARNTQLILMEESKLGHVIDPAGGSWFVERLTRDLAEAAWEKFQAYEAAGGLVAALQAGLVQRDIAAARAAREKALATRKEPVVGVTDFPLLGAKAPEVESANYKPKKPNTAPMAGADIKIEALAPIRWAAPFEALRDKAETKGAKLFFANLGPLAEFSARSNFARNLLAAGGIAAIDPEAIYESVDALAAAFKASGATVAILNGADARYAAEAGSAAKALKAAGASWLLLAGKPGELETALVSAGVDQFIFAGQDALKSLETAQAAMGL